MTPDLHSPTNSAVLARRARRLARMAAGLRSRPVSRFAGVAAFLIAAVLAAHVSIPLPHTPVPLTLQTLVVTLAGLTLGARFGAASMGLYVLLGAAGCQVFAGGAGGFGVMAGPTAGYLGGFVLAPAVVAWLSRPRCNATPRPTCWPGCVRLLLAMLTGHVAIFGTGLTWLHVWSGGSLSQTLAWGLWPFVPGAVLTICSGLAAAGVIPAHVRNWFDSREP